MLLAPPVQYDLRVNTLSVWAAILLWGAPQLSSGGSITGTIQAQGGGAAANVRVVAMAVPNTARRAAESAVFESIAQTDSGGRYRLDNISPGRYYIAAGPVTLQTFHPGTLTLSSASIVMVTRNAPLLSGVDFTLSTNAPSAAPSVAQGALPAAAVARGGVTCCRLQSRFFMEDKSPVPSFPKSLTVVNRNGATGVSVGGGRGTIVDVGVGGVYSSLGFYPITYAIGTTVEIAVEGLPPGYVLKSVAYGGKDFGLTPFQVDGKSLGTLDMILGYDPVAILQKVTARGKVINPAPEWKVTSIRFASTMANGPVLVASLQPDGNFDVGDIPVGLYRTGVIDPKGGAHTSANVLDIRAAVSGLVIDLKNNPFPEFDGVRPERTVFFDGKSTQMTGVVTQKLTRIGTADSAYFRLNVKDAVTGAVTPWAVFLEHEWHAPKIVVGETLTVPGVQSTDGTMRFSASPF